MSEIRVNTVVAAEGTSAPNLPYGIQVPVGYGITGAGGINVSGASTAAAGTFSGAVNIDDTTDSTSSTTGALIVDGGAAIAKNVYIGAGLSVAGTVTYQDVTEVDAVGLITAQSGVNITGGQLQVGAGFSVGAAGVGTFAGNLVVNGNIDLEGDIDVNGTCEADAYTVAGTALDTHIAGVTVTNATNSAHVYVTDNESTNESNLITFVEDATSSTGNVGLEMDGNLTYNPSSGTVSATTFSGAFSGSLSGGSVSANGGTFTGDVFFDNGSDAGKDLTWDVSADALVFSDSVYANFGGGNDLKIYHDGSNSYIEQAGTGSLYIRPKTGEDGITLASDGAITISYDNSEKIRTTNNGVKITGIGTFTQGANFDGILSEKFNTTAGKLSANTNIDLENGMIHFFTTQETTTCTPNIRYNSSKSLNNMLTIGDSVSVTVITTAAAGGYSANWTVDGSAVTEEWNGGSAPDAGGDGGYDCYTITLLKTANATFTVLANVSNFA